MRNNKSLAAAITTALSFTPGIASAVVAALPGNQLENVGNDAARAITTKPSGETIFNQLFGNLNLPPDRFDFTAGESIILVPAGGVPFAAELFGTGTLTLPTPLTSSSLTAGNSGQNMAVIYTIDGEIPVEFEMTFTLDNGATFATNPVLGVRDGSSAGQPATVKTIPAADASGVYGMVISDSSLGADAVFRFAADATLYQVAATDGSSNGAAVTFFQLGSSEFTAGKRVYPTLPPTVAAGEKVYPATAGKGPVAAVSVTGAITGTLMGTTGATTLEVVDSSKFTVGWSYMCNSAYGPDTATNGSVFTVTNKTTGTPHKLFVSVQPTSVAGKGGTATGGFGSTVECSANANIYRVHIKGDTAISVTKTADFAVNHIYQFDNLGAVRSYSFGATSVLSHQVAKYAVTKIDGPTSTIHIQKMGGGGGGLEKTIQQNGTVGGEMLYDISVDLGDEWSSSNTPAGVPKSPATSAAGKNVATFNMKAGTTTPKDLKLINNDQIMLLYKLGNVNALAEPGQAINMTVELKTPTLGMVVNPLRTVQIAKSVSAVNTQLKSIEGGKLNIAVSTGSTQFSGEAGLGGLVGYVDNYVAQIGQVIIDDGQEGAVMEDGVTPFNIKNGAVLAENSTLTITGGQFQSSTALPGKVSLHLKNDAGDYVADQVTSDAAGWTAVWNLNTTEVQGIIDNDALVWIRTNGTLPVNTVEEQPHATFVINYDNASYQDVTEEADIRKITKDGTVCTVYNVPPPKKGVIGADQLSIRVTNDSALSGKLMGKLYSQEGGDPIWSGDLTTEEVAAGATTRFTSEDLETITGVTWDGRAVLEISTILPKIEVLALIRQNGIRMAPLSSLSAGAHGTSCAQD